MRLGEEIKESVILQKVLIFLPMRFDPNISALEERVDMNSIRMDKLHGIFTTYEMRTISDGSHPWNAVGAELDAHQFMSRFV
jgi:hypothetical protein